jgi:hypothetical protein
LVKLITTRGDNKMGKSAIHGRTGVVTLGSTTYCATDWTIKYNVQEIDVTTFCSTGDFREYMQGFKDASGTFVTLEAYDLLDTTGSGSFGNDGVTYSGDILMNGHSVKNPVEGRVEFTWDFRFTGPVTITVAT